MSLTNIVNVPANLLNLLESKLDTIPAISAGRREAFEALQNLGLPGNKHEEYRHMPLAKTLEKNFTFATAESNATITNINNDIASLDAYHVVFVNGAFNEKLSSAKNIKGVTLTTLEEALTKNPEAVLTYLFKYADHTRDAFVAWNTAGWQSGIYISVDDNAIVDKPVLFHYFNDATQTEVVNITRNLIVAGKSSHIKLIQKFDSSGDQSHFTNIVTEAEVKENAQLDIYSLQADHGKQYQFNQTNIHQENFSRVNSYVFTLDGKMIRNNLHLILDGEGCESHMYGLYLLDNDTLADNHTVADHQKPNSFSNELYKGVIDGNAKGVFNGKIYVRPNAQKTNAFQSNRNILLTDKATVNTKPQLEIWADDVKCSHGCTSGQIDEEALFYLQARGIGKDMALGMLLYAFAGEVLDNIKIDTIRTYLEDTVSRRLHKTN